jgi:hypothetical protein
MVCQAAIALQILIEDYLAQAFPLRQQYPVIDYIIQQYKHHGY